MCYVESIYTYIALPFWLFVWIASRMYQLAFLCDVQFMQLLLGNVRQLCFVRSDCLC